jgi:uncharacterized protein (TIGR04255 family)
VLNLAMGKEAQKNTVLGPLAGPPPEEVPLDAAPLVRVIAQVRFPIVASIERQQFIAPFQEAIRKHYPVLRAQQSRGVAVSSEQGVVNARTLVAWSFHEANGPWRVVLAPGHVALETTEYSSRDDFMTRFERVVGALEQHIDPQVVDRVGVRYIDRVTGPNISELSLLIRPEVAGILGTQLQEHAQHSITESVFTLPGGNGHLTARWGLLPPEGTVDPAALTPIRETSWILDIDVYKTEQRKLEVDALVKQARNFAERVYSLFRWAVTPDFLKRYGATHEHPEP